MSRTPRSARGAQHALFEPLEARQLLATITWDGGGDGTSLDDAANWTGDVMPGFADDAVINVAGTPNITYTSGNPLTFNSLTCAEHFSQTGGTLSLAAPSSFTGGLSVTGGVISGTGDVSIGADFTWNSGTLSGTGTTTIQPGVTVTMSAGTTRVLSRALINDGHIVHSAGLLQFAGGGTLSNAAGHVYTLSATGAFDATGLNNTFNNAGTFNDQTGAVVTLAMTFNNSGSLNVFAGGILRVDGGGTNSGIRNIAAGAVLNYRASYTHAAGSTSAGGGILNFNGGTQTISGNWSASSYLQLLSGTLDGPGNLTTDGPFTWGAGTMQGSGNITIDSSGKLALTTTGTHTLSRAIVNNGNLHFLNGTLTMGGATITNTIQGTFAVLPNATITASAGTNIIDNDGLFRKMGGGTITLDSANGGITMNNTRMVDVRNGVLNLNGPVSQFASGSLMGGTWQVYPTGTLSLGSSVVGTLGFDATVNMVGGGATFANIAGLSNNQGTINLSLGGIYQITPAGGTFTNNGTIRMSENRWLGITGNFVQGGLGGLDMDLLSASQYSRVQVSGTSTIGGFVGFFLINSFVPTPGMVFNFFQSAARAGTFFDVSVPTFNGGHGAASYTSTGVNLVIS